MNFRSSKKLTEDLLKQMNEAVLPVPSRIILTKNKATRLGHQILQDILPHTYATHIDATNRAKKFIQDYRQTDYRSDSRFIETKNWGNLLISFTQFYWYKGLTPAVTCISFNVNDSVHIEVYDFVVDTKAFSKEMKERYNSKVSAKTEIPISADNTEEQKKFPRLVEIGNLAAWYFKQMPVLEDEAIEGMGNAMSFLINEVDIKRLYDYKFFEWNQFAEAEYFAKSHYLLGYDVYKGKNSENTDSVMVYILKNQKPLPIFKRKYFQNKDFEKQTTN